MQFGASSSNTSAKRKIKNVVNGHIDTKTKRSESAKRDTYYIRSEALIKKAEEIDLLTGCVVRLEILPTWPRGSTKRYVSAKFQEAQDCSTNSHQQPIPEFELSDTSFNSSHVTPKKSKKIAKVRVNENICSICHIEWETEEDVSTDSVWINCNKECSWWVHTRCIGIHYENTDKGKKELEK